MASNGQAPVGPDLTLGIPLAELREGEPLLGHVAGEQVLLTRFGDEVRAIGATCTHYGGPLAEGLVVDDTVRCPWHHACFSLRTGEALAAPALNPVPCWEVEVRDDVVRLGRRLEQAPLSSHGRSAPVPGAMVIVGAGAAGSAAAEMLRREGFDGRVVLIDSDPAAPYDRPNLSKDYLAGNAPEEWIPLRPEGFYAEHGIERLIDRVDSIDREERRVRLASGDVIEYDRLLLATGATPRTLPVPGADRDHVLTLRSLDDCRRIIERAGQAGSVVVIGASFIGMEAAASIRARGLPVTVVEVETVPFARTLGPEIGATLRRVHEENGVAFRLGRTLEAIEADHVVLDDGSEIPAGLVVIGVGVSPDTRLAEAAGLEVENGVLVDEFLRTSDPRIHAAGDIARWTDPRTGERVRVEHWVVAQRQGQAAARSMLGRTEPYLDVPFFWTAHFGLTVDYVGHAKQWDRIEVDGDPAAADAELRYHAGDRVLAVATINRNRASLEAEMEMYAELAGRTVSGG